MYIWGKGRAAGRVGSDVLSAIAGRVGSTFRRVGSGRVYEKWPVDNPDINKRQFSTETHQNPPARHTDYSYKIGSATTQKKDQQAAQIS